MFAEHSEPTIKLKNWGNRPWAVNFRATAKPLPEIVDYAVVGGGFSGLAAAAWLKRLAPEKSVALLEAETIGSGASGHTGGLALAESAAGNLPGLGDVLPGYKKILSALRVDGDVHLPGVYELGRTTPLRNSPIRWSDSGELRAVNEVPGGTIDPGKVITGLAAAAERSGVLLFEDTNVESCSFQTRPLLETPTGVLRASQVLFATNAYSLELTGWKKRAESCFTIAVATEPLSDSTLRAVGLDHGKPFYTLDGGRSIRASGGSHRTTASEPSRREDRPPMGRPYRHFGRVDTHLRAASRELERDRSGRLLRTRGRAIRLPRRMGRGGTFGEKGVARMEVAGQAVKERSLKGC